MFTNPQMIIALSVALISLCALFVSAVPGAHYARTTGANGPAAKAAAWPRLIVGQNRSFSDDSIRQYQLVVLNKGIGPAIVEGVRVRFRGRFYQDWWELLEVMRDLDTIPGSLVISNGDVNGAVMRAGDDLNMFDLGSNEPLRRIFYRFAPEVRLEICYRSVFDDYWIVTQDGLQGSVPITYREVSDCGFAAAEQFQN